MVCKFVSWSAFVLVFQAEAHEVFSKMPNAIMERTLAVDRKYLSNMDLSSKSLKSDKPKKKGKSKSRMSRSRIHTKSSMKEGSGGMSPKKSKSGEHHAPTSMPTPAKIETKKVNRIRGIPPKKDGAEPEASPTSSPSNTPTQGELDPVPSDPPTPSPVETPTLAPEDPLTPSPVETPTLAPVDPPTPSPVDPPTTSPVDPPTPSPVDPPTPSPVDPPTPSPQPDEWILLLRLEGQSSVFSLSRNGQKFAHGSDIGSGFQIYSLEDSSFSLEYDHAEPGGVNSGNWVSLAGSGNVLAATREVLGQGRSVEIHQRNGGTWNSASIIDAPEELSSSFAGGFFGLRHTLSQDGRRLVVSAPYSSEDAGNRVGRVFLYQLSSNGSVEAVSSVPGDLARDRFGFYVAISDDGNVVAIGAPGVEVGNPNRYVRVYQVGADGKLESEPKGQLLVGESVALSADGMFLAVGTPFDTHQNPKNGTAQVYEYDGSQWSPVGEPLFGSLEDDAFGSAVGLSGDGRFLAVGAPGNDGVPFDEDSDRGSVQVFENQDGTWTQVGGTMYGVLENGGLGGFLDITADGFTLATSGTSAPELYKLEGSTAQQESSESSVSSPLESKSGSSSMVPSVLTTVVLSVVFSLVGAMNL